MIKNIEINLANIIQILTVAHTALPSLSTLTGEDLEDELRNYYSIMSDCDDLLSDLSSDFNTLANVAQEINASKPTTNIYKTFEKVRALHLVNEVEVKDVKLMEALQ